MKSKENKIIDILKKRIKQQKAYARKTDSRVEALKHNATSEAYEDAIKIILHELLIKR
jgi:hypothetical protein